MSKPATNIFETLTVQKLEKALYIIKAIGHPLRLKIISFIDRNQSVAVNKIYSGLNLEQSITSQHLHILRHAKIVRTKRSGKFIYYSLNYPFIEEIIRLVNDFLLNQAG